ncbi:efflux RND transporter periplasmic adaptor subunit [Agarivorans sp. B2Z047]|uniref:efflux RND transporter periplasmic adaptor subunit n=1 Tax=Agarivorans sp. B2Z047 TaxID=2652721 RepID=UPI00128E3B63|nr:efflux RND transporter periplasmic adaptor subunit [Agarivorans sp. B2Z047]MPW29609.1 efflux RND transporter periplasmic adaptor subunit [Agarivorans sp. B2Z047]UQN45193.1 efflux RND transporter periplasmic adaptor subunit [Agarivorans sp. B2Z047]
MYLRYVLPPVLIICMIALIVINQQSTNGNPARSLAPTLVTTEQVQQHSLAQNLSLIGTLDAEQSVAIAAEVSGKINQINVRSNQRVQAGDVLVKLNDLKASAALAEARAYLADEQRKLYEFEQLLKRKAVSQTSFDAQLASVTIAKARLQSAQSEFDDHTLTAPFTGVTGLINISNGELINANQSLLSLDNLSSLQLDLNVPDQYLSLLSKGMPIQATTPAWPQQIFEGTIDAIDPRVDSNTLNLTVRVNFDNTNKQLKPGMMMRAKLTLPAATQAMIPVQAIEYSGTKRFVYVVGENNIAHRTEVQLGARINNYVLIDQGLALNDNIVVQGLVNIRDGARIKQVDTKVAKSKQLADEKATQEPI